MARPRRRRAPRKLTRAQRHARAPHPPDGAILAYRVALRRVSAAWVRKVRDALSDRLEDFALERRADANEADASEALDSVSFDTGTVFRASSGIPEATIRHSKAEFRRIGIRLEDEPPIAKLTAQWRKDAAARVEKILARERDTIVQLLADSEHRTPDELEDRLEERFAVTASKLDTAAHDDVLTLNGRLTQERQTAAGIVKFAWTTAGNEKVRDSHAELDGEEFDWDDPPEVDGVTAIPGEPPNCQCVAFPILPELDDPEDDEAA